jgi:hypothetical protein
MGSMPEARPIYPVALDVKPPQPTNPLEDFQRILQIKNLQNQQALAPGQLQEQQNTLQQQKLELQDDATWRNSFQKLGDPDSGITDLDGVMKDALKSGVGAKSYTGMAQQITQMKQGYAKLGKDQLDNLNTLNSQVADLYKGVLAVPSGPKRVQAQQQAVRQATDLVNSSGWMDPTMKQHMLGQITQVPTDQPLDDDHLQQQIGLTAMHSELATEAEKNSIAAKNQAEVPGAQAKSLQEQQQANLGPTGRAMAGNEFYQAAGGNQQAQQAINLGTAQKVAVAQAGVANVPPQFHGVAPHLIPKVISDSQAIDQKYSETKTATDNTLGLINAARQGNVSAAALVPLQTALNVTTSQGVHRINRTEVDQVSGAGSALDRVEGFWGKYTQGQPIPPQVLNDIETVIKAYSQGARSKHATDVKSLNRNYGSNVDPDAMDQGGSSGGSGATHRYDPATGTVSPIR